MNGFLIQGLDQKAMIFFQTFPFILLYFSSVIFAANLNNIPNEIIYDELQKFLTDKDFIYFLHSSLSMRQSIDAFVVSQLKIMHPALTKISESDLSLIPTCLFKPCHYSIDHFNRKGLIPRELWNNPEVLVLALLYNKNLVLRSPSIALFIFETYSNIENKFRNAIHDSIIREKIEKNLIALHWYNPYVIRAYYKYKRFNMVDFPLIVFFMQFSSHDSDLAKLWIFLRPLFAWLFAVPTYNIMHHWIGADINISLLLSIIVGVLSSYKAFKTIFID